MIQEPRLFALKQTELTAIRGSQSGSGLSTPSVPAGMDLSDSFTQGVMALGDLLLQTDAILFDSLVIRISPNDSGGFLNLLSIVAQIPNVSTSAINAAPLALLPLILPGTLPYALPKAAGAIVELPVPLLIRAISGSELLNVPAAVTVTVQVNMRNLDVNSAHIFTITITTVYRKVAGLLAN